MIQERKTTAAEAAWNADGLDPVAWPGTGYELVRDTPGFVAPADAAKLAAAAQTDGAAWRIDEPERPTTECLYTLDKDGSPWRIRARLGGSGADPDSDRIDYVLEFKCLAGDEASGFYKEKEISRGSLLQAALAASVYAGLEQRFAVTCSYQENYRIVSSWAEVDRAMKELSLATRL